MAEKRALKKALQQKRKELEELNTQAAQVSQEEGKKTRQIKKKVIEQQKILEEDWKAKKARGDKSRKKFAKVKTDAVKHLKTSEELSEFEKIMNGVSKEMERDPESLYAYLRKEGDRLIGKAKNKLVKKKPPPKEEEKKSSIKLSIDEL
jgi:hypothetical protein